LSTINRPVRSRAIATAFLLLALTVAATGCGRSPSGPAQKRVALGIVGDPIIYAAAGGSPTDLLRVVAVEEGTNVPVPDLEVRWQVTQGSATLTQSTSTTDDDGVAATSAQPAPLGAYQVRASAANMAGSAPIIEVRVVAVPIINSVEPAVAAPGAEVVVQGSSFSSTAVENAVYFDGIRGTVLTGSSTQLRVVVPSCLPARSVNVVAGLGGVLSTPRPMTTTGTTGSTLSLQPGQVRTLADPAELACVRLPGTPGGALYLFTAHNASSTTAPAMPFELRALAPGAPLAAVRLQELEGRVPYAEAWEAALRDRERALPRGDAWPDAAAAPDAALPAVPDVGERRQFNVLKLQGGFDRVTATARIVTTRAVLWVDDEAAGEFSSADLQYFGGLFDDPIYPTTVATFGEPSDVDGNQRIFILFTPRVNALTPRNQSSYITGFFYGCDLLARSRCSGSNEAEIFYSLVPDPGAKWSSARTVATVRAAVPPILAHEFQHMIHFARRGFSADVLWLSEALAHTAEELVADVLQATNPTLAHSFRTPNLVRAQRYLSSPASSSLLALAGTGSLEMRGGVWLLLKHARGHYGGNDLLRRLTSSSQSGVANLTQQTGQPWSRLAVDFDVALWADGAPELGTTPLEPRYRFQGFNLRAALSGVSGGYTLRPSALGWNDFAVSGAAANGSSAYFLLTTPLAGGEVLSFVLSGARGAPFQPGTGARLSILRVR
jgi:hypothetical protein